MKRRMIRHAVEQPLDPSYRIIPLSQGKNALVSAHRYELVNQFNWTAELDRKGCGWYAMRKVVVDGREKRMTMHRFITNNFTSPTIDHRNGDGLDNRDDNLRAGTVSQNGANCGKRANNKTGYKGVQLLRSGKFEAAIKVQGKTHHLGGYITKEEAAVAYDWAAVRYFGEFAQLNFPSSDYAEEFFRYLTKTPSADYSARGR